MGVLALQGDFREHLSVLRRLGLNAEPVRSPAELAGVAALVLPGGESTTMDKLMRLVGLDLVLRRRLAAGLPVLATCAGVILLADTVLDGMADQQSLGVLPMQVRRNAYGRQPESFEADITVKGLAAPFRGVFIRAPVIEATGDGVEVLASHEGRPVALRLGTVTALTFHPELTHDPRLHQQFLERAGLLQPEAA